MKLNYRKYFAILLIFSLAGVLLSHMATIEREAALSNSGEQSAFCTIGENINCGGVLTSKYSELFGIPMSKYGLCTYLFIALISLFAILRPNDWFIKYYEKITYLFGWGFLAMTFIMAYISAFILGMYCTLCIGMYIVNIIMFMTSYTFRIVNKYPLLPKLD